MKIIKVTLISFLLVSIVVVFWFGFHEKKATITYCNIEYSRAVVAEFSETTCSIDLDTGMPDCSTDYWEEPASEIWTVSTDVFGSKTVNASFETSTRFNFYIPASFPPITKDWSNDLDFDNYSEREHYNFQVGINVDTKRGKDSFSENASWFPHCIQFYTTKTPLTVKYWYGIARGV